MTYEEIKKLLIECDWWKAGVMSSGDNLPSCSINQIASYLSEHMNGGN